MFKKLLIVGMVVAVSGCATHQQANTAAGAGIGAVLGYAIGGNSGAVVGSALGAAVGITQPTQPTQVIIQQPTQAHPQGRVYTETQVVRPAPASVYPDYSVCNQWRYSERENCFRGAEARARQEQARRDREAYQRGYQGR